MQGVRGLTGNRSATGSSPGSRSTRRSARGSRPKAAVGVSRTNRSPIPRSRRPRRRPSLGRVPVGLVLEVLLADQRDDGPLVQVRDGQAGRERCVGRERGPLSLVEPAAQEAAGRDHHDRHRADPLRDRFAVVADRLGHAGREDRDRAGRPTRGLVECLGERVLAAEDDLPLAEVVREQDRQPGTGPVEERGQEERDVVV